MAIERFSSRREALGDVLTKRLSGASRYLRIAGYFRSSLLEVVGEALEGVGEIRVVCNGDLDPHDVKVAKAARDGQEALARTLVSSWQSTEDGLDLLLARERYRRLHDVPPDAVLAERPIYKGGQILRPWQKRFVQTCLDDHKLHGKARYLLADDVGLGKTLSMSAAALVLSLLDDKPVLILAPAILIWQ